MVEFNDTDVGINKLICHNFKCEQNRYNELINEVNEYKSYSINDETAIHKLYARYYCRACDKSYDKKSINIWRMKMRLLKQMHDRLIQLGN